MGANRLPLPKPCILDREEFRFPVCDSNGSVLALIYRLEGEQMIRCRMQDLRDGDIFLKLNWDGTLSEEMSGYMKCCGNAWWEPTHQQWGITSEHYMDYEPP